MSGLACIGEPVSWPRLERFAAGDIAPALGAAIEAHVAACPACRACLDEIRIDRVALPALQVPERRLRSTRWLFAGGGLAVAAAALIAIVVIGRGPRPREEASARPGPRVAVKGAGAVVLSIVRDRDGAITYDPVGFRDGDRFKLRVTCDPGASVWADAIVYEVAPSGAVAAPAFPLAPAPIACGNDVTMPGAFRITAPHRAAALVCVALATGAPPDRAAAAHGPSGGPIACVALTPEPAPAPE